VSSDSSRFPFILDGTAHHLPRPDHFGPFPPRCVRRHIGQAAVRRSTVALKPRQVDLLSTNSSTAQDERNGHSAFLSLHVCPSCFKPLSSVTLFQSLMKLSPAYPGFRYIRFPLLPLSRCHSIPRSTPLLILHFLTRVDSGYRRYPGWSDGWLGRRRLGPSSPYGLDR